MRGTEKKEEKKGKYNKSLMMMIKEMKISC